MDKFIFNKTDLQDVYVIEPKVFNDSRGYFMESYNEQNFINSNLNLNLNFVQDNESKSKKGVLRGLHFQTEHAQDKLVRVIQGEIFDVAVDLRKNSPTYLKWYGIILSSENKKQFYIPKGFAHGFLVISDEATFAYKCTDYYSPQYESGIIYNDSTINIDWPTDKVDEIIMSDKDKSWKKFNELSL
ncbi:MAG: dTDP-4-dehydrorhamnose 3,5-epimerase [Peptostreptococcaceae bacterium]